MSNIKRIGRFVVSKKLVDDQLDIVMLIMARCVVVECKLSYIRDEFEYWAVSPEFDEIKVGEMCPTYSVTIEKIDEQHKVSFKRVSA